jgi:DNA transformation protein
MPVDRGMVTHVMELLGPLGGISGRAMFGGYGIWHDGQMFALLSSDSVLYFKANDSNRPCYEAAGSYQFAPSMAGREPVAMPYFSVPEALLDDGDELRTWARAAIEVAHAAPPRSPRVPRKPHPTNDAG